MVFWQKIDNKIIASLQFTIEEFQEFDERDITEIIAVIARVPVNILLEKGKRFNYRALLRK